jgi:hypothetical protein
MLSEDLPVVEPLAAISSFEELFDEQDAALKDIIFPQEDVAVVSLI